MFVPRLRFILLVLVVVAVLAQFSLRTYASDITPDNLVARHLDSIASAETRAAIKSRVVQGKLKFTVLVGGGGFIEGTWGRVSEGQKSNFVMRFNRGDWRGEQFVFNGDKAYVAAKTASQRRSVFGDFVHSQDYIVKEGLLGGELSTAWALGNLEANHPKLTYAGIKKVDGKDVHDLEYHSSRSSDMQIHLYFDPETFHHVKTVYRMAMAPNVGSTITSSVDQQEIRYTVEERFGDFKTAGGLTLPSTYSIEFTEELQSGDTRVFHWDMNVDQNSENVGLDPKNFEAK